MALSSIEQVRLKTSDRPQYKKHKPPIGDGSTTQYVVPGAPILETPAAVVTVNGTPKTLTTDYTLELTSGLLTFGTAPAADAVIEVTYWIAVFSDADVQNFLDEAGGNVVLASAYMLYAWAADAAKIASKETSGAAGTLGVVTKDLSVRAAEMRKSADAYVKTYQETEGDAAVAEAYTQVAWTPEEGLTIVTDSLRASINP